MYGVCFNYFNPKHIKVAQCCSRIGALLFSAVCSLRLSGFRYHMAQFRRYWLRLLSLATRQLYFGRKDDFKQKTVSL